eukprot:14029986-Alexandrium_andersonii.AAC.1
MCIRDRPWTRTLRPVGPAGTPASSIWNASPFSVVANVPFGCAIGSSYEARDKTHKQPDATH